MPLKRSKLPRRAFLKRKIGNRVKAPKKRTRAKKTPEKKLKETLWQLCKEITRGRYGNVCYTCGAKDLAGANWHTGHFVPSSIGGTYLRWDLRNLRPQCYRCNISLAGNGSAFYHNLLQDEGEEYVAQLFRDKKRDTKLTMPFLREKIAEYKAIFGSQ